MTAKQALLVIDVQQGMFAHEVAPHQPEQLLATIQTLLQQARAHGHPVVYVRHAHTDVRGPLHPSNPGWQIHAAIAPLDDEIIVDKTHSDSFWDTRLQAVLTDLGVTSLVVVGMQSDYCVDTTCRRATSLGYDVTLIADGHSTFPNDILSAEQIIAHHNQTLHGSFAEVVPVGAFTWKSA